MKPQKPKDLDQTIRIMGRLAAMPHKPHKAPIKRAKSAKAKKTTK